MSTNTMRHHVEHELGIEWKVWQAMTTQQRLDAELGEGVAVAPRPGGFARG